jgi:uncharacterized peroxidase-related enzyme
MNKRLQPREVTALELPDIDAAAMPADLLAYFDKCENKLGFVPNVLVAHAFDPVRLRQFADLYNRLMMGESALTLLEREMIAVVVSARNRCHYCLVSHGQAVRQLAQDPLLGEALVMNHRVADVTPSQRAMLDFCARLTDRPEEVGDADRQALRDAGFSDRTIWDIVEAASFYAMSNRMAIGMGMKANPEYHGRSR